MNIVFIGSGNVATVLANGFYATGHVIVQVYSPSEAHAKVLAEQVKAVHTNILSDIDTEADVYIIAVKDEFIAGVVDAMPLVNGLVVHTSGATDLSVLNKFPNHGVLYAPQSFTTEKYIDLEQAPFCLETNNKNGLDTLQMLVTSVSSHIHAINSQQRLALHVAAVLANNFTHYLLSQAQQILQQEHIPVSLLEPIIEETFQRLDFLDAANWKMLQTGPALRGDKITMQRHLAFLLKNQPHLKPLYEQLSQSIQSQ